MGKSLHDRLWFTCVVIGVVLVAAGVWYLFVHRFDPDVERIFRGY